MQTLAELAGRFNQNHPAITFPMRNGAFWGAFRDGDNADIVRKLQSRAENFPENPVFMGVGGGANFSIAAALEIPRILMAAPDDDQFRVMTRAAALIGEHKKPEDFKDGMADFINRECVCLDDRTQASSAHPMMNVKDYELHALNPQRFGLPQEWRYGEEIDIPIDVEGKFKRSYNPQTHRFTTSQDRYDFIRNVQQEGQLGIFRLNVMDKVQTAESAALLAESNMHLAVARMSNILCHYYVHRDKTGYLGDMLGQDPAHQMQSALREFGNNIQVIDCGIKIESKPDPNNEMYSSPFAASIIKRDYSVPHAAVLKLDDLHKLQKTYEAHGRGGRW